MGLAMLYTLPQYIPPPSPDIFWAIVLSTMAGDIFPVQQIPTPKGAVFSIITLLIILADESPLHYIPLPSESIMFPLIILSSTIGDELQ